MNPHLLLGWDWLRSIAIAQRVAQCRKRPACCPRCWHGATWSFASSDAQAMAWLEYVLSGFHAKEGLCVVKRGYTPLLAFSSSNGADVFFPNQIPTITAMKTWCDSETSWLIAKARCRIWKPSDNWVKTWWISNTWWISKTWWKPGEVTRFSPKKGKQRFTGTVFSFCWWHSCVLRWNLGWIWLNSKTFSENLVKTRWVCKTWWTSVHIQIFVNFENLVKDLVNPKTWVSKPGELTWFSPNKRKKRFSR